MSDISFDDAVLDALALGAPRQGRKGGDVSALVYDRDLTEEDIQLLSAPRTISPPAPAQGCVEALKARQMLAARLVAEGKSNQIVALLTDYQPGYVSSLRGDPMFQEAVAYYKSQIDAAFSNVHERLAVAGLTALQELQNRLEDIPESFTNSGLLEVLETSFDRSIAPSKGAGKGGGASNGQGLNVNISFIKSEGQQAINVTPTQVEVDYAEEEG